MALFMPRYRTFTICICSECPAQAAVNMRPHPSLPRKRSTAPAQPALEAPKRPPGSRLRPRSSPSTELRMAGAPPCLVVLRLYPPVVRSCCDLYFAGSPSVSQHIPRAGGLRAWPRNRFIMRMVYHTSQLRAIASLIPLRDLSSRTWLCAVSFPVFSSLPLRALLLLVVSSCVVIYECALCPTALSPPVLRFFFFPAAASPALSAVVSPCRRRRKSRRQDRRRRLVLAAVWPSSKLRSVVVLWICRRTAFFSPRASPPAASGRLRPPPAASRTAGSSQREPRLAFPCGA